MRVQDLIFLDDLQALGIEWVDRIANQRTSHEDVNRVWALLRAWGPDQEDVRGMFALSAHVPHLEQDADKMLTLLRLCRDFDY